jgi:hypothetical protein
VGAELVYRVANFSAVRRLLGMGDVDSPFLHFDIYVRMQHFVRRTTLPFIRLFL